VQNTQAFLAALEIQKDILVERSVKLPKNKTGDRMFFVFCRGLLEYAPHSFMKKSKTITFLLQPLHIKHGVLDCLLSFK
jgi:hypothetical protein